MNLKKSINLQIAITRIVAKHEFDFMTVYGLSEALKNDNNLLLILAYSSEAINPHRTLSQSYEILKSNPEAIGVLRQADSGIQEYLNEEEPFEIQKYLLPYNQDLDFNA